MDNCDAISFQDVSFAYADGRTVLDDLTFQVREGEFVALAGDNGCGKSTIARLICGMLTPSAGEVRTFGMDVTDPSCAFAIRSACGIVFQRPEDQIVATLVKDDVAFGPRNLGLAADEVLSRVDEALSAVGMLDAAERDVNTLSGGEQQRVAIAGALAMHPRLLILDEATSMLDAAATERTLSILRKLHKRGMTILLIAHDAALANAAERTIRIGGPASESAAVSVRPVRKLADDAPTAVELENVSFAYPGSSPVLDGVSLSVRAGELACVTGPNGAGKSTLLSLMNGLLTPDAGEVRLFGEPARGAKARGQARFTVGLAFQQPERQLFSATVFDDVAFGPRNMGLSADEVEERVRWAIDAVGLPFDEVYKRSPFTLSGGQQRKAALAGVLAMRTPVLALDEPAAGLDVASKRELLELLCRLSGEGACVIMVTHDANDVQLLGCREIALP